MKKEEAFILLVVIVIFSSMLFRVYLDYKEYKDLISSRAIYDTKATLAATSISLTVDADPPSVIIEHPENITYSSNESIPLNFSITDKTSSIDSIWYNIDYTDNITVTDNITFNTSEGSHTLFMFANDSVNLLNDTESISFSAVTSLTLNITDVVATADTTPDLNATTNVNAYCEYRNNTESYQPMEVTNSLSHGATLPTLAKDSYTYYIQCNDTNNNLVNDSIVFSITSNGEANETSAKSNLTFTDGNVTELSMTTNININLTTSNNVSYAYISTAESTTDPEEDSSGFASLPLRYAVISVHDDIKDNLDVATIYIYYSDAEVSSAGIEESTLRMYKYTQGSSWSALAQYELDAENNFVAGNTTNFSSFGIGGSARVVSAAPSGGGGGGGGGAGFPFPFKKEEVKLQRFNVDTAILKVNIKETEDLERYIEVENEENKAQKFGLILSPSLRGIIDIPEPFFELQGKEKESVKLIFNKDKKLEPGVYVGNIIIKGETTEKLIPIIIEVESKVIEVDLKSYIPLESRSIKAGEDLDAQLTIFNIGKEAEINVDLFYDILDIYGNKIVSTNESVNVKSQISFSKTFKIPKEAKPGEYVLSVTARYGKSVGTTSHIFTVEGKRGLSFFNIVIVSLLIFLIGMYIGLYSLYKRVKTPRFREETLKDIEKKVALAYKNRYREDKKIVIEEKLRKQLLILEKSYRAKLISEGSYNKCKGRIESMLKKVRSQ